MKIWEINLDDLDWQRVGQWPLVARASLIIFCCGISIFMGKWILLDPAWAGYQTTQAERFNKQKAFETLAGYANHLEQYRLQVQEVKQALERVLRQLPWQSEEAELLEVISEQASLHGLLFRGIKPDLPVLKEFYREQALEFALLGDFHGFAKFIADLSSMPRIVTLQDFSLRKEKGSDRLEILLTAKIYWSLEGGSDLNESN